MLFCMLIVSCDEKESSPNANDNVEEDLENTLDDLLTGQEGSIEDYFYNLSSDQIDAEYHYYDPNAMENPQFFFVGCSAIFCQVWPIFFCAISLLVVQTRQH